MNILYLTFYFEPDLCAGSFRNTAIVQALAENLASGDSIHVITTRPNRYASFAPPAPPRETRTLANGVTVRIDRLPVPKHQSGLADQMRTFAAYFVQAHRVSRPYTYSRVVASSSRLFTAFLGAWLARRHNYPLTLDMRDLFRETLIDVYPNPLFRFVLQPFLRWAEAYTFGRAEQINLVSGGYADYFKPYSTATYSFFTNAIDAEFVPFPASKPAAPTEPRTLLYAGNIGAGQGLDLLIVPLAQQLGKAYRLTIIGDGSALKKLKRQLKTANLNNVTLLPPMPRSDLIRAYQQADYLLVHLNKHQAFRRVLPSKIFEYGATDKPILAGLSGYAADFMRRQLPDAFIFSPGDANAVADYLKNTPYRTHARPEFVARFDRKTLMNRLAVSWIESWKTQTPIKSERL